MEVINTTESAATEFLVGQQQKTLSHGVADDAALMAMLSTGFYSTPMRTMIQEMLFNAWDAHKMVGKEDVKLPDEVLKAFQLIREGQSKGAVGRAVGTSDRSVGQWMDKYDYEGWLENREEALLKAVLASQEQDDFDAIRKSADPDDEDDTDPAALTAPLSKSQQARLMFKKADWPSLIQFKKAAKKGWYALGFNDKEIGQITKAIG